MKISEQKLRESFRNGELKTKLPIIIYDKTDSTNNEAKNYIRNRDANSALFITSEQTAGKGRLGRSFISDRGGLYMTLLVRLDKNTENPVAITAYTAVVVRNAIESLSGISPKIKWVNDILIDTKKVCGILTEGVFNADTGNLEYAIVGIGINVRGKALANEISDIATTLELCGADIEVEMLAAEIVESFFQNFEKLNSLEYANEYRRHSMLIGKEITVIKNTCQYPASVMGINDKYELILKLRDGTTELLYTGEVSVRL